MDKNDRKLFRSKDTSCTKTVRRGALFKTNPPIYVFFCGICAGESLNVKEMSESVIRLLITRETGCHTKCILLYANCKQKCIFRPFQVYSAYFGQTLHSIPKIFLNTYVDKNLLKNKLQKILELLQQSCKKFCKAKQTIFSNFSKTIPTWDLRKSSQFFNSFLHIRNFITKL